VTPTATSTGRRAPPVPGADDGSPIDPRLRERRAGVLRSEARRRLRRALAVLALVALALGAWALLHSRLFSARVVTVTGAVHVSRTKVVDAAGLAGAPPLVDVNAGADAARVELLPWVKTATVTLSWPDGVRISVVERTPVAVVPTGSRTFGWALVDESGRVLALDASRPPGLVEAKGAGTPGAPGSDLRGTGAALTVAATLPKAFAAQVSEISQTGGGDVTLQLTSPLTVYLGSTSDLAQKYEDVAAILSGVQLAAGQVIDVSAPGVPVVKG
jgi:cell division protein FtsQ